MSQRTLKHRAPSSTPPTLRWWNTLSFRLAIVFNVIALGVLATFWGIDYRRERAAHLATEVERLREEARMLRAARADLLDATDFQRFVDTFCRQMGRAASPGHHIVLFDPAGQVIARAHEHDDPTLEAKMVAAQHVPDARFAYNGEEHISVGIDTVGDGRLVVTQSLAPVRQIIRAQAYSRAVSFGVLVALVGGVTTVVVLVLVRDPLRQLATGINALGGGRFDVRVRPSGNPVLRYVAARVNEMATTLEGVERLREAEMNRARSIQSRLLPALARPDAEYGVAAVFRPAASVGGDLYDILEFKDGSTLVAVLDVAGHGVAAALYTALLRAVLHYEAEIAENLTQIAAAMNRKFMEVAGPGDFVTCFLVHLRPGGLIGYVRAGHDPGFIVRASGSTELLADGGVPIGIMTGEAYSESRATLGPGDRLFLYTDGLHEASSDTGMPFGREQLAELLVETSRHSPAEQLDVVVTTVASSVREGGFDDDVTLLCAWRPTRDATR